MIFSQRGGRQRTKRIRNWRQRKTLDLKRKAQKYREKLNKKPHSEEGEKDTEQQRGKKSDKKSGRRSPRKSTLRRRILHPKRVPVAVVRSIGLDVANKGNEAEKDNEKSKLEVDDQ